MNSQIIHRGPDSDGYYFLIRESILVLYDPSIIDLHEGSQTRPK